MYEFKFSRPGTVRQAANLLAKTEDAKLVAGGHTLIPVLKQRLARPAQPILPWPPRPFTTPAPPVAPLGSPEPEPQLCRPLHLE